MRITFKCTDSGKRAGALKDKDTGTVEEEFDVYYVKLNVWVDGGQKYPDGMLSGTLELTDVKPLPIHFKTRKKYTMDVNEHSGLITDLGSQAGRDN